MKKYLVLFFLAPTIINAMDKELTPEEVVQKFLWYLYSSSATWSDMYLFATTGDNMKVLNKYYQGLSDRHCMLINSYVNSKKFDRVKFSPKATDTKCLKELIESMKERIA